MYTHRPVISTLHVILCHVTSKRGHVTSDSGSLDNGVESVILPYTADVVLLTRYAVHIPAPIDVIITCNDVINTLWYANTLRFAHSLNVENVSNIFMGLKNIFHIISIIVVRPNILETIPALFSKCESQGNIW